MTGKETYSTYVYPRFSAPDCGLIRLGGAGLGNLLFLWARAVALSYTYNLRLVSPTWRTIKVGPLLRGERDKRWYWDLFHGRSHYIRGFDKLKALTRPRITEQDYLDTQSKESVGQKLVVCQGARALFTPFLANAETVRQELWAITRDKHKPHGVEALRKTAVVNIRLGDFLPATMEDVEQGKDNRRVPMDWYLRLVELLRSAISDSMPILVVSDGSESDLAEIMSLPHTRRLDSTSAIEQLLAIGSAGVLIASGSTFSMWGSFIGGMPVIWPKGQLRQRLYGDQRDIEIEMGIVGELPAAFVAAARQRLRG